MHKYILGLMIFVSILSNAQTKKIINPKSTPNKISIIETPKEQLIEIKTDYGIMVAKLYNATPLHRDNFIAKIKAGFYDSLKFHRIIKDFMIQGGDPTTKYATDTTIVGNGAAIGDKIPAEFNPNLIHKKGVLAAARDGNPLKASSNCQFYIVQGKKYDSTTLQNTFNTRVKTANPNFSFSTTQAEIYNRIGGTPQLDQNYTVFGEVISGLDIIDIIANTPTKPGDKPIQNIRMFIRLLN